MGRGHVPLCAEEMRRGHLNHRALMPIAAFFFLTGGGMARSEQGEVKADDLSNMIIKGENRLQVKPEPPAADMKPNLYRDLENHFKNYAALSDLKPPSLVQPPISFLATESHSQKTAKPWLDEIREAPVLALHFR